MMWKVMFVLEGTIVRNNKSLHDIDHECNEIVLGSIDSTLG